MIAFGTTEEQLGAIAVTCRRHAHLHPDAVLRERRLTMDGYLARVPVPDPLRLEDCCLTSDGAAAFVMTAAGRALDGPKAAAIVAGMGYGGGERRTFFAM